MVYYDCIVSCTIFVLCHYDVICYVCNVHVQFQLCLMPRMWHVDNNYLNRSRHNKTGDWMSQHGKIPAEDRSLRWELFSGNDVKEGKQVPVSIGAKNTNCFEAPKAPKEKSLKELQTLPEKLFETVAIMSVECYQQRTGYWRKHSQVCRRITEADNSLQVWRHCWLFGGVPAWLLRLWIVNREYKEVVVNTKAFIKALETAMKDTQHLKAEALEVYTEWCRQSLQKRRVIYHCGQTNHKASDKEATWNCTCAIEHKMHNR